MILPDLPLRITGTRADGSPFDPVFDQQLADDRRQQLAVRSRRPALQRSPYDIQLPPRAVLCDHVVPWGVRERGRPHRGQDAAPLVAHGQEQGEVPLLQRLVPTVLTQAVGHLLTGLRYLRRVFDA